MADSWMWWIVTCAISLYFVMLLIDFNKPSKKLMEQIDHQETRRRGYTLVCRIWLQRAGPALRCYRSSVHRR